MDKNLLVKTFVPYRDSREGEIGTGYPVAPGVILTAAHVLFPKDRDEGRPIEVRWFYAAEDATWHTATILWEGRPGIDVALLGCEFPREIGRFGRLSRHKPKDTMRWASEGFAEVGEKNESGRYPVPMLGQVHSSADKAATFHIGVDYSVALETGWRGASGSPVFVDDEIVGVVVTCPRHFDQRRLQATPTWRLLDIPGFRQLVETGSTPLPRQATQREPSIGQFQVMKLKENIKLLEHMTEKLAANKDSAQDAAREFLVWKREVAGLMQSDHIYLIEANPDRRGNGLYGVLRSEMKNCRTFLVSQVRSM